MKIVYSISVITMLWSVISAQNKMFSTPLSPRIASYQIDVRLDPESRKIVGSEVLTWKNISAEYIPDLRFHLYLNAFKNEQSTFIKESGGRHRYSQLERDGGWGWINVDKIKIRDGIDITDSMRFIQPDNDNTLDETVMQVVLPAAIKPYETVEIEIEFEAKLPQVFARTGYKGDFFLVGQWFPKIGVYERAGDRYATEGQWNCHQYHAHSEFYAAFGVYDVRITVPDEYIVGASGIKISEEKNDDTSVTHHYYCEDIHDFAWTADKDFIVIEDQWQHVKITYLVQPLRAYAAHRQIRALKNALAYCNDWFGPYPYPVITMVDPQFRGLGAGGMEYPTFITVGMFWLFPDWLKLPEEVTVHEFAHNYFYGILASNEFEEAWLDEGMTTYAEMKIMNTFYGTEGGSKFSLFGLEIDNSEYVWYGYQRWPKLDVIYKNSWEYKRGGYGLMSYSKPALMLLTLENYLGQQRMKEVMRTYYERYKFKHPTTLDFTSTVNDVTGQDYGWFFDQILFGSDVLDYKVERIMNKRIPGGYQGIFGDPSSNDTVSVLPEVKTDSMQVYESKVTVAREGEVVFPVEVLVRFYDGSEIKEIWDGKDRFKIFTYKGNQKVVSATVDPDRKIWLDINFLNNGKTLVAKSAVDYKYNLHFLYWTQYLLQLFAIFS